MIAFLEILKYTIPALIVFATAYLLLKQYLDDKQRSTLLEQRSEALKTTLQLRLQAYERLTLLCDRSDITNVLLRIRMPGMTIGDLRGALLIAVRQEFEHNTSQQLYVSDTLWRIITFARDQTMEIISESGQDLDPKLPDDAYVNALLQAYDQLGQLSPLQKSIIAIRTEAGQLF